MKVSSGTSKHIIASLVLTVLVTSVAIGRTPMRAEARVTMISLQPQYGPPETPISVSGYGFTPNKSVDIEWQGQVLVTVTADHFGLINATIIAQVAPSDFYPVEAEQANILATTKFYIQPAWYILNPPPGGGLAIPDPLCIQLGFPPPSPLHAIAWGLPANVPFTAYWGSGGSVTPVGSGTTTALGFVRGKFLVPDEPSGTYNLTMSFAGGALPPVSYYTGTYTCMTGLPLQGNGSIQWITDGVGWDANSTITFTFNTTPPVSAVHDGQHARQLWGTDAS